MYICVYCSSGYIILKAARLHLKTLDENRQVAIEQVEHVLNRAALLDQQRSVPELLIPIIFNTG